MSIERISEFEYDIVCDGCGDTQLELLGEGSFESFQQAVAFKKENKRVFFSVKDIRESDPKEGWSDLCAACRNDRDVYAQFIGRY